MKREKKIVFATILLIITLFSAAFAPRASALKTVITPQEKIREQVEGGFNAYMKSRGLLTTEANVLTYFSQFLHQNPSFANSLATYANLTKPDINSVFPSSSKNNKSPSTIDVPFKVFNTTINGNLTQISYSKAVYPDGSRTILVKIGCGGFDPEFAFVQDLISVTIDGIPTPIGENDFLGLHFFSNETQTWKYYFDQDMDTAAAIGGVVSFLFGLVCAIPGAAAFGITACLITATETSNLVLLKGALDNDIDTTWGHGLYYCFAETYIYTPYQPAFGYCSFEIYGKLYSGPNEDDSTYLLAYPQFGMAPWGPTYLGVDLAFQVRILVDQALQTFTSGVWYPCQASWPLPTLPTSGPTGLSYQTLNCYDGGNNQINANVYIDGASCGISNTQSLPLTPTTHTIIVDQYTPTSGGYGYTFDHMTIEGNTYYDTEVTTDMSANSSMTFDYTYGLLPYYSLTINAYDCYFHMTTDANIYVDSNYVGTGSATVQVLPGDHTVTVDYQAYNEGWNDYGTILEIDGNYNGNYQIYSGYPVDVNIYLTYATEIDAVYTIN